MERNVLIIGNGFDLDLGWKTSFSSFAYSQYWNKINKGSLFYFLDSKKNTESWFDLESLLGQYGEDRNIVFAPGANEISSVEDKATFIALKAYLREYLEDEQSRQINKNSYAVRVFKAIIKNGYFPSIYSFNYTDLKSIADKIEPGLSSSFEYEHVHGAISDDSIILGTNAEVEINSNYLFLRKVNDPNYSSHNIQYDLFDANHVVIFGHSLGKNDYHFFEEFFSRQCDKKMQRADKKKITIFTYDANSRIAIIEHLRKMNSDRVEALFSQNDFKIICTNGMKDKDINEFLSYLNENSLEKELEFYGHLESELL